MQEKITWIVVTSAVRAIVYKVYEDPEGRHHKKYDLLQVLSHEESRLKSHDLATDKLGRYNAPMGPSRGKYMASLDPHEKEQVIFAKEIAHFIETGLQRHQLDDLIICAAPHFCGLLNQAFSEEIKKHIVQEIHKDYIPLPQEELKEVIEKILKDTVKL